MRAAPKTMHIMHSIKLPLVEMTQPGTATRPFVMVFYRDSFRFSAFGDAVRMIGDIEVGPFQKLIPRSIAIRRRLWLKQFSLMFGDIGDCLECRRIGSTSNSIGSRMNGQIRNIDISRELLLVS